MIVSACLLIMQLMLSGASAPSSIQSVSIDTSASSLTGQWIGSMTLGPTEYPINVWFDDASPMTGRIQLVGISTDNNPLTDITISGNTVTFSLASRPPQKFVGELQGGILHGTIDIGGLVETFSIQKIMN